MLKNMQINDELMRFFAFTSIFKSVKIKLRWRI